MDANRSRIRSLTPDGSGRRRGAGPAWIVAIATFAALAGMALPGAGSVARIPGKGASVPTDIHCGECHETDPLFSHPVQVAPSMTVPTHLPLEDGRLTCVTCHRYYHVTDPTGSRESRLMRPVRKNSNFCSQCHSRARDRRSELHGQSLRRAHLRRPGGLERTVGRPEAGTESTRACLGCHDGVLANNVSPGHGQGIGPRDGRHPVDVPYHPGTSGRGRQRRTRRALRPSASLDERIRLFAGQVGCGSCHSPYSPRKHLLVMSTAGSRLCLGCHEMD